MNIRLLCACLLVIVPLVPATAGVREQAGQQARPADTAVEYTVMLREPQTQMLDMAMSVRGVKGAELEVCLPVWRPGRYQVLDPSGSVREVHATSGAGRPLKVQKTDKSRWVISRESGDDDEVVVSYRAYCNSIGDRTRHVDNTHAFLSPAAVFMYAPDYRGQALKVRVDAPEGWDVATGLERDPEDEEAFLARDYDVLVDSPLEIGVHERLRFEVDRVPHEIVIWNPTGQGRTLDEGRITGDLAKIVRAEREVFGETPYSRYVFLVHAYPGGSGGTEHLNSTIMGCSPAAFRDEDAFKRFLGLVSHEFFHTWNIKQLRPAGLKPYDYQRENYTDLLWVAEGTTSYMDGVCMVRAGLTKPDDYLRSLSGSIDTSAHRPGGAVQSVAESSFDAWVKFNKPSPDAVNSTVSFYDKGALVSFLLDMEIRAGSAHKASLDMLLRELYRAFPLNGPGFTSRDLEEFAQRLARRDMRPFFARFVEGTEAPDYGAAAAAVGLELVREPPSGEPTRAGRTRALDAAADEDSTSTQSTKQDVKTRPYFGLTLESRDGLASVATVLADGPAYSAGVIAGDLVVAVNGQRVRSTAELDAAIKGVAPGDPLKVLLFRYDTLREITMKAAVRPEARLILRRVKNPTKSQREGYESWLGQAWPASAKSEKAQEPAPEPSARPDDEPTPLRRRRQK
jgi:predicted metalloprotease with PDZ domain